MRAIVVSVNYSDLLAVTLPANRHHFESVWIVTSTADAPNVRPIAEACGATVFVTDLFYARGAAFNKWAALEAGLDVMGRHGAICLLDADILWPRRIPPVVIPKGKLWSPLRRMLDPLPVPLVIPPEREWTTLPIHRNVNEWAGYSQAFWADDPALGLPPWHQTDWQHAGGADSFFQARWHPSNKIRPDWHCLHLGPAGVNWTGRASDYTDGTTPPDAGQKRSAIANLWHTRRARRAAGRDPFAPERLAGG